ncbi:MAG: hypothetical protein ACLTYW_04460 [Collinsella sp.]
MALTDISHPTDIAMLTDLYELTMAQGLWESGKANEQGCLPRFTATIPLVAPTPSCAVPPSCPSWSRICALRPRTSTTSPRSRPRRRRDV